jgi:hypothetical protein
MSVQGPVQSLAHGGCTTGSGDCPGRLLLPGPFVGPSPQQVQPSLPILGEACLSPGSCVHRGFHLAHGAYVSMSLTMVAAVRSTLCVPPIHSQAFLVLTTELRFLFLQTPEGGEDLRQALASPASLPGAGEALFEMSPIFSAKGGGMTG